MTDYNNKYSSAECYFGKNPHSLVVDLTKHLLKNAKILDLGAGEGKNAIYLAKQGFDMVALDSSEVGIKKIKQLAQQLDLQINAEVDDVINFLDKGGTYDAIIGINVLQFLKQSDINNVIEKIKIRTNIDGFNAIVSFIAPDDEKKQVAINKNRYLFNKGELKKYYDKWDVLKYVEKWSEWETHGEDSHQHYIVSLLAQKRN
ncbi:MAG: methyltransferase domain-containing protein [bacterium]